MKFSKIACAHDHANFIKNLSKEEMEHYHGHRSIWFCNDCHSVFTKEYKYDTDLLSDGYHTFGELYEIRHCMFAAICNMRPSLSWKTKNHHPDDEPMYHGYFEVGTRLSNGEMIKFHIENKYWDLFQIREYQHAPKWDGKDENPRLLKILLQDIADETEMKNQYFDREFLTKEDIMKIVRLFVKKKKEG